LLEILPWAIRQTNSPKFSGVIFFSITAPPSFFKRYCRSVVK